MDIDIIANDSIIVGCINAGYQGENNAQILNFTIPEEYSDGDIYLDWQLPNGQKTQTAALIGNSFAVPHEFLTASGAGKMDVVYKSGDVKKVIAQYRVTITSAIDADSTIILEYQDVIQDHESRITAAETGKANTVHMHTISQVSDFPALLALGETSTTAYRGDRGKTAYDHSQATGNPHSTTASQISITDQGGYYAATNTETALAEAGLILKRLQSPCISAKLTQAASVFHFTQCDDGTPLNFKRLQIAAFIPAGSNVATGSLNYLRLQINGITTGYQDTYGIGGANVTFMTLAGIRNVFGVGVSNIFVLGNGVVCTCQSQYGDSSAMTRVMLDSIHPTANITSINDLYMWVGGGGTVPAGTTIKIWGMNE